MIKNICTIFDENYLLKGLTLYRCLKSKINHDFTIHCLCIDEKTFNVVNEIKDKRIKAYSLKYMEETNETLIKAKNSRHKSNYGDAYSQYCWTLTPFFCNLMLSKDNIEEILYIDSDIYFYEDFSLIKEELKNNSIGIVTHRTVHHLKNDTDVGKYNVGIVYFKGDNAGMSCSEFWKNLLINPNNEYAKKYGTCGDQKYLELFEIKFEKKVCIIDDLVGHGAPWCFHSYEYLDKYNIIWQGKEQNLIYNHFSHFKTLEKGGWSSSTSGEWKPENLNEYVKEYYEDYYKEILITKKEFDL